MPRPVHFEIHATEPQAIKTFYSELFGWSFHQWGDQPYWLVATGDGAVVTVVGLAEAPGWEGAVRATREDA